MVFFSVVSSSGSILMHVPLAFGSMLLILASCWLFCHLLLLVGGISLASCYDSPASIKLPAMVNISDMVIYPTPL